MRGLAEGRFERGKLWATSLDLDRRGTERARDVELEGSLERVDHRTNRLWLLGLGVHVMPDTEIELE